MAEEKHFVLIAMVRERKQLPVLSVLELEKLTVQSALEQVFTATVVCVMTVTELVG